MYLGTGLFLLALGAILTWAVDFDVGGLEVNTIGVILMVVGAVGIIASLVMGRRREVVRDDHVV